MRDNGAAGSPGPCLEQGTHDWGCLRNALPCVGTEHFGVFLPGPLQRLFPILQFLLERKQGLSLTSPALGVKPDQAIHRAQDKVHL